MTTSGKPVPPEERRTEKQRYGDGAWAEIEYLGDELDGLWTVYYPNGKKNWEREYAKGMQHGYERHWSRTGTLIEEKFFCEDKLHGPWRTWFADGRPKSETFFEMGKEVKRKVKPVSAPPAPGAASKKEAQAVMDSMVRMTNLIVADKAAAKKESIQSWLGEVTHGRPGESTPTWKGRTLFPLCQIVCQDLPHVPEILKDLQLIIVFISTDPVPMPGPNGDGWVLRAYPKEVELVEVPPVAYSPFARCPIRYRKAPDYPPLDATSAPLARAVVKLFGEKYYERFPSQMDAKVGGWPTPRQGFAPFRDDGKDWTWAIQIDERSLKGLRLGDAGIMLFQRKTKGKIDDWEMYWDCY
jgi:hypothetical protein